MTEFVSLPLLVMSLASPAATPIDRLPQNAAGAAVRHAIAHAGGWTAWESKKTVELKKTTRTFSQDGSVAETRLEMHRYRLRPGFGVRIETDTRGKKALYVNNGQFATKVIDSREDLSVEAARESRDETFAAEFLFGLPFKLTDPGARLECQGQGSLEDGTLVERVRAVYEAGTGDAGGLHAWTYFFDSKSGSLRAARVDMGPDKSLCFEFSDEKAFDGLRVATRI